jgi:uncharacterized membrane protein YfhO
MDWSPAWRATLDGVPVETWRSHEGMLNARVPAGAHALVLRWEHDRWDALGAATTLVGVVVAALVWRRSRRAAISP